VNVVFGFDNNPSQEPSSERPDIVVPGAPGVAATRYGVFGVSPLGWRETWGATLSLGRALLPSAYVFSGSYR
jgi:hypothetical protein